MIKKMTLIVLIFSFMCISTVSAEEDILINMYEEIASPVTGEFSVGTEMTGILMQQDFGGITGNTNGMDGFENMVNEVVTNYISQEDLINNPDKYLPPGNTVGLPFQLP